MSRSGYSDECDGWQLIMWRGAVTKAINGKRGQQLLRDMAAALDAMPVKQLISDQLVTDTGHVCALGAVAVAKGIDVAGIDPDDRHKVAAAFDIAPALASEIAFMNDDDERWAFPISPEARWLRVRSWVEQQLQPRKESE